jgi:hypothetical protein
MSSNSTIYPRKSITVKNALGFLPCKPGYLRRFARAFRVTVVEFFINTKTYSDAKKKTEK